MNLIQRGQNYLNRVVAEADGVTVTYTRGSQSVSLVAAVGRTAFRQVGGPGGAAGAGVIYGDRDYLITAAALFAAGLDGTPQRGDRITQDGVTYECLAPGGEPAWRYSDPGRTVYRIHVKRVG